MKTLGFILAWLAIGFSSATAVTIRLHNRDVRYTENKCYTVGEIAGIGGIGITGPVATLILLLDVVTQLSIWDKPVICCGGK